MGRLIFTEKVSPETLSLLLASEDEQVVLIAEKTSVSGIRSILPDKMIGTLIVHADGVIRPGLVRWLSKIFGEEMEPMNGGAIQLSEEDIVVLVKLTAPLTTGSVAGYNELYARGNVLFYSFHICLSEEFYAKATS